MRREWAMAAVIVWIGIVAGCCGRPLLAPRHNGVYDIFALAGRNWLAGADMYGSVVPELDSFRYSPLVGAVFTPLGLLPDGAGGALWRLINAAVFLAGLAWWSRALLPASLNASQKAMIFLLVAPLAIGSLHNGQSNALVLGMLLAGVAAVARDRFNLAAGLIAAATLFKIYPIALGLLLALVYPRRFAGRFVLALGAGLALPFALQHGRYVAGQYGSWVSHLQTYDRQRMIVELWYRDIRLLLLGWVRPFSAGTFMAVQLLAAAGCAAICLVGRRLHWPDRSLLIVLFALACCWMTLFGPATESCTYIFLSPVLAWALLEAWQRWPSPLEEQSPFFPAVMMALVLASYGLLLGCQMAVWFPFGRAVHSLGLQPYAGLLLLVSILMSLRYNRFVLPICTC